MLKQFIKYYLRNGKTFEKYFNELKDTEKYSQIELHEYQNEKLQRVIKTAYDNVPHYRKMFDERCLNPSDVKDQLDLYKLPIIDKKVVQTNFIDFKNKFQRVDFQVKQESLPYENNHTFCILP